MDREKRGLWSRRDFFSRIGWAGFGVFGFLSLVGFLRSAFPRVLFQPASSFKAGYPSDYTIGEVSDKFKQDYRVWIVREDEGFYARLKAFDPEVPGILFGRSFLDSPCHGVVSMS